MIQVTYIGNFLSKHGLNPTYSEALVPQLVARNFSVRPASRYLNPILRLADMVLAILRTPAKNACVILDLCSGPRAFPAAYLISRLCRCLGKPYVVTLHGGTLPKLLITSRKPLLNLLRGAKRVVSPSGYLAEAFSEFVNVEVIPNALTIQEYSFRLRGSTKPNFLFLRALHKDYGTLTAIRAFAIVQKKYANARLTMAGPDYEGGLRECERLVEELGLTRHVHFLGRVPKVRIPELGNENDIFLNPTFVDNTPVSTVEAMAMGMCVVATTAGGLSHLLKHEQTALLVTPGSERETAEAMLRILEQSETALQLSANARKAAENMDWRLVVPRWSNLIESVAR